MATMSEVASFQRFIFSSIDRLMALLNELRPEELNWKPPAKDANSFYGLATHVLGNAEENIEAIVVECSCFSLR